MAWGLADLGFQEFYQWGEKWGTANGREAEELLKTEEEEEEGAGCTVRQDQERTVTREHEGGRGGRLLGRSTILSLIFYDSTIWLLRQGPHTFHTVGRNG